MAVRLVFPILLNSALIVRSEPGTRSGGSGDESLFGRLLAACSLANFQPENAVSARGNF
eukprot:COSAG01_NODE_27174_length_692_cov_1.310287_1_plen_59_part_00